VEALLAVSFVRTLLLIAVAGALSAWIFLVEAPRLEQEAKAEFLLDVDPASVEKVRMDYPDGSSIEAVREGEEWKLTAPVAYPADSSVVANFLTTVQETKIERRLNKEEAGALSSYGLEGDTGSQARLELTEKGGKALPAVVFGISTPVGHQAFARREGSDEVLVVPLLLQSTIKKNPDDLRRKAMFSGDTEGVNRVSITGPNGNIVLERRGENEWILQSPLLDEADAESVRSMLDSIATIDATGFYDGDKADRAAFGLADGATRFLATREDGSTIEFLIGKEAADPPAGLYFERTSDGQVVKAPDWVKAKFAPPVAELRQKRLLSCRADEILSMTWRGGGGEAPFTIAREAAGKPWTISPEVAGEVVNQRVVDNAVRSLVTARADEVVGDANTDEDLARWGLDAPSARLEVAGTKGSCASLAGAVVTMETPAADREAPAPRLPGDGRVRYVKNAARSAVLRASEHEFSRITTKRPAFVDASAPADEAGEAEPEAAPGN
ncbi:MAG: DUF4340 domain-containing protein, partial [Candidatus Binatia bacterium]